MSFNNPFFSVVIPVYNKAPYVARSVASVLNQTFRDFELIIVDDASTDGSMDEVKKFSDPRIRLLHRSQPGPGGYAARNLGIYEARAEWIAFLDADDKWYLHHLSSAYYLLKKFPDSTFVSFGFRSKKGDFTNVNCHSCEETLIRHDALKIFAERDMLCTNAIIARKTALVKAGGFPAGRCKRGGDSDLWLRLMLTSDRVVLSPEVTSVYEKDHSGIVADLNTTATIHPVASTIKAVLKQKITYPERTALKKLANRKSFSWSLSRRRAGSIKLRELWNYYPSVFSLKDWRHFLILILPQRIYRLLCNFWEKRSL